MNTFNLPDKSDFTQIFYNTSSGSTGWQTWLKPKNISFINILCIGGGAGGGGARGNTNNSAGGGGGGGSAAFSNGLFPASLLPDRLYVLVGRGGVGGTGGGLNNNGGQGGSGELSYVSVTPSISNTSVLMKNGDVAASGGGGSTSSLAGSLGNGGGIWVYTVSTANSNVFPQLGQITATVGVAGVAGGAVGVIGNSITITSTLTGGAGGGGNTAAGAAFNGGSITGVGIIPTIVGGTANSVTLINGREGLGLNLPTKNSNSPLPLFFTGGSGGGSGGLSGIAGGDGGDGSFGCGGGGGGGAYNNTGGSGGRGGDGLIIFTCW